MIEYGVRFQPSLGGTLHLARTNAFFLGGGKALINAYYRAAEALGVDISYDTEVTGLKIRDGRFTSATVVRSGFDHEIRAKARGRSRGRLRVQPRLAEGGVGPGGGQFPHPRHCRTTRGACCEYCSTTARNRSATRRRATALRSTRARRSSTAASARGSTACRSASSSTSTPSASTTRARISGRSATRSGAASSRAAGPDRLFDHRRQIDGQIHAAGVSADQGRLDPGARAGAAPRSAARSKRPWRKFNAAAAPGNLRSHGARRLRDGGPLAAEDALGAADRYAAVLRLSAASRHHVHLPRRDRQRARASDPAGRSARRRTSSPRAKSWPATFSARATWPASA